MHHRCAHACARTRTTNLANCPVLVVHSVPLHVNAHHSIGLPPIERHRLGQNILVLFSMLATQVSRPGPAGTLNSCYSVGCAITQYYGGWRLNFLYSRKQETMTPQPCLRGTLEVQIFLSKKPTPRRTCALERTECTHHPGYVTPQSSAAKTSTLILTLLPVLYSRPLRRKLTA